MGSDRGPSAPSGDGAGFGASGCAASCAAGFGSAEALMGPWRSFSTPAAMRESLLPRYVTGRTWA